MMEKIKSWRTGAYLSFIHFTRRHPRLSRTILRFLLLLPGLHNRLSLATRLFMGGRALDAFEVDLEKGEVRLGGLDWRIHGSEYIEITHRVLGKRMGRKEAQKAIYDMAKRCVRESLQYADHSRLFPSFCVSIMEKPAPYAFSQDDTLTQSLYRELVAVLARLVFPECGWGTPQFDELPVPNRVILEHSVEAFWINASHDPYWEENRGEPSCSAFAGMLAGFVSHITGGECEVREVECAVAGSPRCVFEVRKAGA